jgi:hypothetical protein
MFWQKILSTTMAKASNSKRKKSSDKPLSPLSPACKKARKDAVEKYALEVVDARTRGKGQAFKETYGSTLAIIHKAQYLMPWITATMIKSKADRITKLARKIQPSTSRNVISYLWSAVLGQIPLPRRQQTYMPSAIVAGIIWTCDCFTTPIFCRLESPK